MHLRVLLPLLPIALVALAPLACSSSSTSSNGFDGDDGGDQTSDDGGDTTNDGGTKAKDSGGPFTPGAFPSNYPQVPNNAGGIITNPKFVLIIPSNETTPGLNGFGAAFAASETWKQTAAEYKLGTATSVTVAGQPMSGSKDENAIQSYVENYAKGANAPDGHTIYLVFLPSDAYIANDQGCNTQGIGGYHTYFYDGFSSSTDGWGVVQHCTNTGQQGLTEQQWATIAGSHEIVEAATDFDGQSGYALPQPSKTDPTQTPVLDYVLLTEVGDLCVATQITEGSYTYQRMWSNKAAKSAADPCIPANPDYFNTGISTKADANGWYKVAPGGTLALDAEGYSLREMDPWYVGLQVGISQPQSGWSGNIVAPEGTKAQPQFGNGEKGKITVNAPSSSGAWAIFVLGSQTTDPSVTIENPRGYYFGVYTE